MSDIRINFNMYVHIAHTYVHAFVYNTYVHMFGYLFPTNVLVHCTCVHMYIRTYMHVYYTKVRAKLKDYK